MRKRRKLIRRRNKNIFILLCIAIIVFFLIIAKTKSKYFAKLQSTHTIESSAFYFESNLASVDGIEYDAGKWDGINPINLEFYINNFENEYLITGDDIKFTIEAEKTNDSNNDLNVQILSGTSQVSGEQVLTGNTKTTKNYKLKISKAGTTLTQNSYNIKLKINSSSPYRKELIGNINITKENINSNIDATLSDNAGYVTLNLKVNDVLANKTITYDNTKLTLDKSNTLLSDSSITTNSNKNSFTISSSKFETGKEYQIIFIKTNNIDEIKLGTDIIVN